MTSKMNTWLYKYKGMQALRTEDDDDSEASLPMFLEEEKKKNKTTTTTASSWPWVPLACTLLLAASALSFHLRWSPHGAPLDLLQLPPRPYTFVDHPEMRPFDQATSDVWLPWGRDHWWSMEWRDPASGARLTQGIDMLHKLHCLVSIRDEFTLMATDQDRRVFFNDRTAESVTRRMHIKHCFDFIRGDILCAADATVEPLDLGYTRSDGLGIEHQCRDWDIVMKYAAANEYFPEQLKGLEEKHGTADPMP